MKVWLTHLIVLSGHVEMTSCFFIGVGCHVVGPVYLTLPLRDVIYFSRWIVPSVNGSIHTKLIVEASLRRLTSCGSRWLFCSWWSAYYFFTRWHLPVIQADPTSFALDQSTSFLTYVLHWLPRSPSLASADVPYYWRLTNAGDCGLQSRSSCCPGRLLGHSYCQIYKKSSTGGKKNLQNVRA